MKVLIAAGIYPPSVGGTATYTKILYDNLPSHDVEVVVSSFDNLRTLPRGVRHLLYFIKILIDGIGKDVIYAQDSVSVGFPAMWTAKILKKKFILKVSGDYAWEQGVQKFGVQDSLDDFVKDLREYQPQVLRIKKIQKKVAERADKIIVPSRYLKKIVGQWGINKNKISVVFNAVDEAGELPDSIGNLRDEVGFVGPTIITAGRLVSWKGFETLITAVEELRDEFKYIKLLIIGGGPEKQRLEEIIVKKQLFKNVQLTGLMDKQNLFKHVAAADLFVLNSGYEGFSHQLLEVLTIGTPAVTTREGGNPELINDGENGLLVDYDDREELKVAIRKVFNDKMLARNLSKCGKETVKQYSVKKMIADTVMELKI